MLQIKGSQVRSDSEAQPAKDLNSDLILPSAKGLATAQEPSHAQSKPRAASTNLADFKDDLSHFYDLKDSRRKEIEAAFVSAMQLPKGTEWHPQALGRFKDATVIKEKEPFYNGAVISGVVTLPKSGSIEFKMAFPQAAPVEWEIASEQGPPENLLRINGKTDPKFLGGLTSFLSQGEMKRIVRHAPLGKSEDLVAALPVRGRDETMEVGLIDRRSGTARPLVALAVERIDESGLAICFDEVKNAHRVFRFNERPAAATELSVSKREVNSATGTTVLTVTGLGKIQLPGAVDSARGKVTSLNGNPLDLY